MTLALQQAQLFVSVLFIGHISGEALEIDAISLALSVRNISINFIIIMIQCLQNFLKYLQFINVSSLSIAIGLSTASDTLSSQVSYCNGGILKIGGGGGQGGVYHIVGMAGGLIWNKNQWG